MDKNLITLLIAAIANEHVRREEAEKEAAKQAFYQHVVKPIELKGTFLDIWV